MLSQSVDVSKYPDIADQTVIKREHRRPGVLESFTGRCQAEHLALVGAGVGEAGKRQVSFGDAGKDFVVKVGSEALDVIDVFAELVEPDLGLAKRPSKVDVQVEDLTENGLVEPVPHVVVETVYQSELLNRIHSVNLGTPAAHKYRYVRLGCDYARSSEIACADRDCADVR